MRNTERIAGPFLKQRVSRRGLGRKAIKAIEVMGGVAAGITAAGGLTWLVRNAEMGPENLTGQPIEGEGKANYITKSLPDVDLIPVRKKLSLDKDDIDGRTIAGVTVQAQPVLGPIYGSQLIHDVQIKGRIYKPWYRADEVPLYKKDEAGEFIPDIDENGQQIVLKSVFIGGNFVAKAINKDPESK